MKWFKHFSNASHSDSLADLVEDFGFEGYGRYWRLLEILAERFDGESVSFKFHSRLLRDCLRFKSAVKLNDFLVTIGLQQGFNVVVNENQIEIEAPILLDLQDRDFKKSRSLRDTSAPKNKIKIKIKNKDKEEKATTIKSPKESLDFEIIYKHFPKKEGKKKGLEKLKASIKTQEKYEQFCQAAQNYIRKCDIEQTQLTYIKMFSSFVNCWEDYLDYEPVAPNSATPITKNNPQAFENRLRTFLPTYSRQNHADTKNHFSEGEITAISNIGGFLSLSNEGNDYQLSQKIKSVVSQLQGVA